MKLFLLLLFSISPSHFDLMYELEKMPVDSAIKYAFSLNKNNPDSQAINMSITLISKRVSSYDFAKFMKEINSIEKALPRIDSIFDIYKKHFTVYDSLLYNYLKLSLFTKKKDEINKILINLLKKYRDNPSIVSVLTYFAYRYRAKKAQEQILPYINTNILTLSNDVLFTLLRHYYSLKNFTMMQNLLNGLSARKLKMPYYNEYLKYKGYYFEGINRPDSALFYLSSYAQNQPSMDMEVARHLVSLYIENNDYSDAKSTVLLLLSLSPFNANLRKQAGYIYFLTEQYDSSLIEYLLAKSLSPKDPEIHYYISRIFIRKKLYKDALKAIEKALRLKPIYDYKILKAYITMQLGDTDDAERELLILKNKGLNDPYYFYLTGIILKDAWKNKIAYEYLKKSIQMDSLKPIRFVPLLSLAAQLHDTPVLKMAVRKAEKIVLTEKDDIFDLAYAAQEIGYVQLADSLYRILINKDPERALLYNNLGYLYLKYGSIDTAEKYLKKAYELSPKDPYILDSYAWLLFKKGFIEIAYKLSKRAHTKSKDRVIQKHYKVIKHAFKKRKETK